VLQPNGNGAGSQTDHQSAHGRQFGLQRQGSLEVCASEGQGAGALGVAQGGTVWDLHWSGIAAEADLHHTLASAVRDARGAAVVLGLSQAQLTPLLGHRAWSLSSRPIAVLLRGVVAGDDGPTKFGLLRTDKLPRHVLVLPAHCRAARIIRILLWCRLAKEVEEAPGHARCLLPKRGARLPPARRCQAGKGPKAQQQGRWGEGRRRARRRSRRRRRRRPRSAAMSWGPGATEAGTGRGGKGLARPVHDASGANSCCRAAGQGRPRRPRTRT